ncbi:MAG: GHMP kinase [Planctomycetes bacterium]|nr:GHMP kinase [Planctomycetota bacterium]
MIITQTPLRVSFLGGGTDYPEHFEHHGGAVLGSAVAPACYFTVAPFASRLFDYRLRVAYRNVECVRDVGDLEHRPFRECLKWAGLTRDAEITLTAELPAMTGLGSSSAFTVGLLGAIRAHQQRPVSPLELAYRAVEFERDVLGESVGCQDQTFAAVGGFNLIEFRARDDFRVTPLALAPERLRELEAHLLVFYTGIRRRADALARAQTRRAAQNAPRLNRMRALVDDGHRVLTGPGSLLPFGELLHESWQLKRALDRRVSSPTIDEWYQTGIDTGAVGGKLLGAGAGGFLLFFAPPEAHAAIRARLADLVEVRLPLDAPGSRVVFDNSHAWRAGGASPMMENTKREHGADAPRSPQMQEVA